MYQKGILKLVLLITCSLAFSGCATSNNWFKSKDGDYDFFLETSKGEKIKDPADGKTPKGGKEAKAKANAAMQEGDTDTALFLYVKALEHDEKDQEALNGIANIHFVRGNNELAILAFRMILANNPDNLDAKQGLGLSLIKNNKYAEAREVLLGALRDNPQRPRIYNGLGVISDIQHFPDEARWFFANALLIDSNNSIALTNLAYSYYLDNQWDNAEKMYKKVIENDPKHIQAHLNLGLLQARKGELFDALKSFQQVLPEPQAYNELGYIMMLDRKYSMAEQLFQKAISASPSYFAKAHENLERLKELQIKRNSKVSSTLP